MTRRILSPRCQKSWRPHVAQNTLNHRSAIDGRPARRDGHRVSRRRSKLVEQAFGLMKTVACLRMTRFKERSRLAAKVDLAAGNGASWVGTEHRRRCKGQAERARGLQCK